MMIRDGNYDEAVTILEGLHRSHPANKPVLYDYVTTLAWAGQYEKAAGLTADFVGREVPEYALASAALAQRHSGNLALAEKMYREGVERFPLSPDFSAGLALTLADAERFGEAREALSGSAVDGEARSQAQEAAGYIDRQEADYQERQLERRRELVNQRREDAVGKARAGQYQVALWELAVLSQENPGDQAILADYLTVAVWAGRNREATRLATALDLAEAPDYAISSAGLSLRQSGQYAEARRLYEEGLARFPENFDLKLGLAWTLAELSEPVQALEILKGADDGLSEADRARLMEAQAYLRRMLPPPPPFKVPTRSPAPWRAEQDAAVALAREGRLEEGLAILAELHRRYPDDQYLLGDYMILRQWNREHDQVVGLAKKIDLNRAPVFTVITAAQSMARLTDWAASERLLERAAAV